MLQTLCITVTGQVQGVFFRQGTKIKAKEFGITGIVKNNPDGSVTVIATGTEEQLRQLVDWCKVGPPNAIVTDIQIQKSDAQSFKDFVIQK
jgi:acylphosphatase